MSATVDEFVQIFEEFADVSPVKLNYYLNNAINGVNAEAFGNSANQAIYLLTAHALIMNSPERASKATVTSERVGDVSVSYQVGWVVKPSDNYLSQTQYGLQYIHLRDSSIISMDVL